MTTSGSYSYDPLVSDIGLDAFDRIQVRPSSITPDHMFSLRRSINSVLVMWANRGINLWAVDQQTVPLIQSVATYNIPTSTVTMLETVVRNYQLGTAVDLAPAFATTNTSTTVTITYANHGLSVDDWLRVVVPVSIGGIVLQGFYQVASVPSTSSFTITAGSAATATASGGAVPAFTTTATSTTVAVVLADHGYADGDTFSVQVSTSVGGLTLLGAYTVAVVDTDHFTITAPYAAGSTATVSENGGSTQIAGQSTTAIPTDRLITPISRTDYAAIASKGTQGGVTSYYFDRTVAPTVTLWPVPDGNGPYELRYYRMRQLQTATPSGAETMDVPYRFQEALCSALAYHLAIKWRPEAAQALKAFADERWEEAAHEDRQRVPLNIGPDLSSYYG